jgi:hypothetical protein
MEVPRRLVPLNAPRSEELITVTAESPLRDERRISTGATVSQTALAGIPTSRDPWAIVQRAPGVMSDRVNVGGNESGQQTAVAVEWILPDCRLISPGFDFDAFEEMQVTRQPSPAQMERVTDLARKLEKAAASILRKLERRRRSDPQSVALLRELHDKASRFQAQVETHRQDPWQTRAAFEGLLAAFTQAASALSSHGDRDHLSAWIVELSGYYRRE